MIFENPLEGNDVFLKSGSFQFQNRRVWSPPVHTDNTLIAVSVEVSHAIRISTLDCFPCETNDLDYETDAEKQENIITTTIYILTYKT